MAPYGENQLVSVKVIIFTILFFGVLRCVIGQSVKSRNDKLLNVFNIVQFPNDGCNASSNAYGVCYTATECTSLGGSSSGSCASGFGVCCTFSGGCGASTSLNNTYFKSNEGDSSPCTFSVCKASTDICQIRLGFDTFDIMQPSTNKPGDDSPNGRTQCQQAQFSANSAGPSPPVICGTNTGYHMILEARSDCNRLSFTWTSSTTRTWNIHILQISCSAIWKPPEGCLQHFTGVTGYIYSYNYAGGVHLANQQYSNCIRAERGYCSIGYTAVTSTDFQLSLITPTASPTAIGNLGDSCSLDYITLFGGGEKVGASTNQDRFCGSLLVYSTSPATLTTERTVITNKMPFQVGVNFDGTELDEDSPAGTEWSKGFYLHYSLTIC